MLVLVAAALLILSSTSHAAGTPLTAVFLPIHVGSTVLEQAPKFTPVTWTVAEFSVDDSPIDGGDLWYGPAFSGDGEWAVYPDGRGANQRLYRINVRTKEKQLVSTGAASAPAISADGSKIAFLAPGQYDWQRVVHLWTESTGQAVRISDPDRNILLDSPRPVAISDDGSTLAWTQDTLVGRTKAVVFSKCKESKFTARSGYFLLSGDGNTLIYDSENQSRLALNLASGESRPTSALEGISDSGAQTFETTTRLERYRKTVWSVRLTSENRVDITYDHPGTQGPPGARISGDGAWLTLTAAGFDHYLIGSPPLLIPSASFMVQ